MVAVGENRKSNAMPTKRSEYCYAYGGEKRRFKTREEAIDFIEQHNSQQYAYKCCSCLCWHITSHKSQTQKEEKRRSIAQKNPEMQLQNDFLFGQLIKLKKDNNL